MKKLVSVLLATAMVFNLSLVGSYAAEDSQAVDSNAVVENGYKNINGNLFTWIENDEISAIGMLDQDGTVSLSWFYPSDNVQEIFEAIIPADMVNELPETADGSIDLQYVVNNTDYLALEVSILPLETQENQENDLPTPYADNTKRDAILKCIRASYNIDTYHDRMIVQSNRYSGVTIQVFESKNFYLTNAGAQGKNVKLKQGMEIAAVATSIVAMALPGWTYATALSYLSAGLGFTATIIPVDMELELFEGAIQYVRTSAYKGANASSYTYTPFSEEKTVSIPVAINYKSNEGTGSYNDKTKIAGDAITSYLTTEEAFSENSIIVATYDYYKRH